MPKKYKILIIFLIFFVFPVSGVFSEEKKDPFNVAILKEEGLKYAGLPDGLNAEWIGNVLKDEYNVIFLNIEQLKDRTLFNADNVDLLILPYGDMAPEEVSPEIVDFIRSGGGLFTAGGRPFSGKYLLQLGISYYIVNSIDIASLDTKRDILKLEFEMKQPFINQYGLCVKTSERIHNIVPTIGNVFPFRIPARDFMNPVIMLDKEGNYIGASITLVKSWSNPYKDTRKTPNKWCLIGSMGDNHPLNPKHESSKKRLKDILKFLSAKVILKYVDTEYASYRNGEAVNLNTEVLNYGDEKKDAILDISIEEGGRNLFKVIKNISMSPGETVKINTIWNPVALDGDFYEVSAVLRLGGRVIDEGRNAFTVWHRDKLINFPELAIKGRRFYQNGLPVYLHGINYYESKRGALMWARPNILDIEKDLRLMSKAGINFLRAHYHHPGWFKDYFEAVGLPVPAYFENTENIERSLRIMDAFIILCNRHGIYFQPDIFTLVPSGMGDPKGWIGDIERCRDKEKIEAQKKFIDILAARYKDIPNITWDLWNEPFLGKENIEILRLWVEKIRDCFKQNKDTHLITLGSDESIELAGGLDFLCGHSHDVEIPETDKPFIMQEVWNESDLSPEREIAQKEKLKKGFLECIKKGGAGFAPWQWTRQSCLWDDASDPEKWDNELGLCVREDGSLKPAGKMYKNLIKEAR